MRDRQCFSFFSALLSIQVLASCTSARTLDLKIEMSCNENVGPQVPQDCAEVSLGCVNFFELTAYGVKSTGELGDSEGSRCWTSEELDSPRTLCDLLDRPELAAGPTIESSEVVLRLQAMFVDDPSNQCRAPSWGLRPVTVFDGFSAPTALADRDVTVPLVVSTCSSCRWLPAACASTAPECAPALCAPGTRPVSFPGSESCCPIRCEPCDLARDECSLPPPPPCPPSPCPPLACSGGTNPIQLAGMCCPLCAPPIPPR